MGEFARSKRSNKTTRKKEEGATFRREGGVNQGTHIHVRTHVLTTWINCCRRVVDDEREGDSVTRTSSSKKGTVFPNVPEAAIQNLRKGRSLTLKGRPGIRILGRFQIGYARPPLKRGGERNNCGRKKPSSDNGTFLGRSAS